MHPYFSVMDERWFHRAFVYTGSVTDREKNLDFRYRYEQVKGLENVTLEENLNRFPAQNKISAYAIPALQWAVDGRGRGGAEGVVSVAVRKIPRRT